MWKLDGLRQGVSERETVALPLALPQGTGGGAVARGQATSTAPVAPADRSPDRTLAGELLRPVSLALGRKQTGTPRAGHAARTGPCAWQRSTLHKAVPRPVA